MHQRNRHRAGPSGVSAACLTHANIAGRIPEDASLFAPANWPDLRCAVSHLSWLLTRAYAWESALKLVGDRFRLNARQRLAVQRSACSDQSLQRRTAGESAAAGHRRAAVSIDGFNLLTTIEAALAGGVLLRGRDECLRDMASVHGSYRKVAETTPAIRAIGQFLGESPPARCTWWLDRPVSNSGRAEPAHHGRRPGRGLAVANATRADPDRELKQTRDVVVTADSVILDACNAWVNLASGIVDRLVPHAWIVPLNDSGNTPPAFAEFATLDGDGPRNRRHGQAHVEFRHA